MPAADRRHPPTDRMARTMRCLAGSSLPLGILLNCWVGLFAGCRTDSAQTSALPDPLVKPLPAISAGEPSTAPLTTANVQLASYRQAADGSAQTDAFSQDNAEPTAAVETVEPREQAVTAESTPAAAADPAVLGPAGTEAPQPRSTQLTPAPLGDSTPLDNATAQPIANNASAAALAGPSPLEVTAGALTLAEIETSGLANNPSIHELRARLTALHGKWVQVGLPPNTVIGYSGQQLWSGGEAEQRGLYVGQQFIRGGKLELNRQVVCREIEVAEQALATQEQRVLTDVRLAYNEVQVAQQRIRLADQLTSVAQQGQQTAELLLEAREVSQLDVLRARVELQTAQLAAKNARVAEQAAWTRVRAAAGMPELAPQPVTPLDVAAGTRIDDQVLLTELLSSSPEVAAAASEVDRARAAWRRQCAEPIPDVDVATVTQHDNATNGVNANVQVTFPLPVLNRNQGAIRQSRAELNAAEQALARIEFAIQQRLANVYQLYANAHNQVVDYSSSNGILANARQALEMVQQGYQAGELNYLDLITAQRTFSETTLTYLEAVSALRAAEIELNGMLLRNSLE